MTCIVGLEANGKVWMGGDSAAASEWNIYATKLKKVFKRGDFLLGYSTSFRMGQLLQYKLQVEPQTKSQDDLEYMATTFIDAVRQCFKNGGYATRIEDKEEEGGQFLVGYKSCLYRVDCDYQVNIRQDEYAVVGTGENFALGSLRETGMLKPKKRIRRALRAAGHFSTTVCKPYYVLSM